MNIEFMQLALKEAQIAKTMGEVPVGAVLVRDDELLCANHNRRETSQDPTGHAELLVIKEAAAKLGTWRLTGTTLYVTLEPCLMCAGAILQSRISRLLFGTKDPKGGAFGSILDVSHEPGLNHQVDVHSGMMETECREVLQVFFQRLRNQGTSLTHS